MVPVRALFMVLLLTAALTAGCLGGDEDTVENPNDDGTAQPTPDTGSVTGTVVTTELEPVVGAQLTLVDSASQPVSTRTTGEDGQFVMNGILPGTYRLQVSAICCIGTAETVHVAANEQVEVPFMLEPFSDLDLQIPYSDQGEFDRLMACMFTLPTGYSQGCGPIAAGNVPNHAVPTAPGLRTFIAALAWNPPEELTFIVLNPDTDYVYATDTGPPSFEFRIDHDQIEDEAAKFEEFDEDGLRFQFEAAPAPGVVVYQKELHYYWYMQYWEKAPEGISVLPDA